MARIRRILSGTTCALLAISDVVVGDEGTIRAAGDQHSRQLGLAQWSYQDQDWLGNNPGDEPKLLMIKDGSGWDEKYCLAVKNAVVKGKGLKATICNPKDERQHFFLDDDKRWRPHADLSLCVDASIPAKGRVLRLNKCQKKGPQQRWSHSRSIDPIKPLESSDLCVSYKKAPGKPDGMRIQLESDGGDKCVKWITTDPERMDEPPQEDEVDPPNTNTDPDGDDYVLIVSRDENDGVNCLTATSQGELKLKECDKAKAKQLWAVEKTKGATIRIRPKSAPTQCVEIGDVDKPEEDIHCCVDDNRLKLKKCSGGGGTKQRWIYNEYGEIHHAEYIRLCISDWLTGDVGMSHCGFESIREYSHDDYRWEMVRPKDFVPLPLQSDPREEDMFLIVGDNFLLESEDSGSYLDLTEDYRKEGNAGKLDHDAKTLWFMDGTRIRSVSDSSSCLGFDDTYRHLYLSSCYRYKDADQEIQYNQNGGKEISPVKTPNLCAVARGEEIPIFEKCNDKKEQRWELGKLGAECDVPDEDYVMIISKGDFGNYCIGIEQYYLENKENPPLQIEECDKYTDEQRWLYTGKRLRPKLDLSFCLEFDAKKQQPVIKKCKDSSSNQKWNYSGDTFTPVKNGNLCATTCTMKEPWSLWSGNLVCLRECAGKDTQRWDMLAPEDYKKPGLPFVHITPKGDKSSGIWCYPDREESPGGCPSIIPIDTVTGKFHKQSLWLIETTKKGIQLRRSEPRGELLGVTENDCDGYIFHYGDWDANCKKEGFRASFESNDFDDKDKVTWRYNEDGNKELRSLVDDTLCLDRSSLTLLPCDGSKDQAWLFQDANEFKYQAGISLGEPADDAYTLIVSKQDRNYCVATKEAYRPGYDWRGEGLRMAKCDKKDPKQLWVAENAGGGGGKRWRPKDNLGLCMEVSRVESMQELRINICDGDKTKQKWLHDSMVDSEIAPYKRKGNLCVAYESSCAPRLGDKIGLIPCNGKIDQGFELVKPGKY